MGEEQQSNLERVAEGLASGVRMDDAAREVRRARPMRVYVAGSSAELHRIRGGQRALQTYAGAEITHDWTRDVEATQAAGRSDFDLSRDERIAHAEADLAAIASADLLWVMAPATGSAGTWCELMWGIALRRLREGAGPRVVISGAGARRTPFGALANASLETDWEALHYAMTFARHLYSGVREAKARG